MTDNPTGDIAHHGPRDMEHERDSAWPCAYVEFGATDDTVVELPLTSVHRVAQMLQHLLLQLQERVESFRGTSPANAFTPLVTP